ncbi:hypothetical protein EBS40_09225, partial [bacterium]|nr:hypothetical protein [bacterium]
PNDQWVVDSGASHTFSPHLSDFAGKLQEPLSKSVRVGDGTILPIKGMGTVRVRTKGGQVLTFSKVHYVPDMHSRLLSVPHLLKRGARVVFDEATCRVYRGKSPLFTACQSAEGGSQLFRAHLPTVLRPSSTATAFEAEVPMQLAHQRLAHAAPSTIAKLHKLGSVSGFKLQQGANKDKVQCEPCLLGKAQRLPFPKTSRTKAQHKLELVHVDLWGPARVPTFGKQSVYVLSILDHYTSYHWFYLLKSKESTVVLEVLKRWLALAERQSERKLKVIRTDNGTEFKGAVEDWLRDLGIQRQLTVPYSPQQNGRVERWHRTMGEGVRTMLLASGLPASTWGETLRHLTWVKNRVVHSALNPGKTPYEMWFGRKPDLSMLKTFGCMCSSLIPEPAQDGKLSPRGKMLVHLGVDEEAKGWRVLDPDTMQVTIARNLHFQEDQLWHQWRVENPHARLGKGVPEEILNVLPGPAGQDWLQFVSSSGQTQGSPIEDQEEEDHPPLHSILRGSAGSGGASTQTKTVRFVGVPEGNPGVPTTSPDTQQTSNIPAQPQEDEDDDLNTLARTNHRTRSIEELYSLAAEAVTDRPLTQAVAEALVITWCLEACYPDGIKTPATVREALEGPQKHHWKPSMEDEMKSLQDLGVWKSELVDLPAGKKAVDGKWVYRIKRGQDGQITRYKSRYVCRGFTQEKGTDYTETFSSVVKWPTIRLVMAMAATKGWEAHVVDIKTAFLRASLDEEVYLKQPEGMDDGTGRVYRLIKAMYGLKQAPRCWEQ